MSHSNAPLPLVRQVGGCSSDSSWDAASLCGCADGWVNSIGGRDGSAIVVGLKYQRLTGGGFCYGTAFGFVDAHTF